MRWFLFPLLFAVAVPISVVPSNSFTVLFAAAVPVRVSVLSLVTRSPEIPLSFVNEVIFGADGEVGGAESMLVVTAADFAPVLPAASVAFAVKLCEPVASVPVV